VYIVTDAWWSTSEYLQNFSSSNPLLNVRQKRLAVNTSGLDYFKYPSAMDALVIERLKIIREAPIPMRSSKSQTGAASPSPTPLDPPEECDLGARP
jgi:hypothetical protein